MCMHMCKSLSGQHYVWFPWWETSAIRDLTQLPRCPQGLEGVKARMDGWIDGCMAEEERWRDDKLLQQVADVAVGMLEVESVLSDLTPSPVKRPQLIFAALIFTHFASPASTLPLCSVFSLSHFALLLSCMLSVTFPRPLPSALRCHVLLELKKQQRTLFLPMILFVCPNGLVLYVQVYLAVLFSYLPPCFTLDSLCLNTHTHIDNHCLLLLVPAPPPPSFPPSVLVLLGAVALTHFHWQITFLMEFNYLSLPCGDLARKRPTARARGRTRREGKRVEGRGKRKGEALISSSGKKLDHLRFDLERCHSWREGRGERDFGRKSEKRRKMYVWHTHGTKKKKKRTNDDMYREFGARHRNLFLSLRRTLHWLTFSPRRPKCNHYICNSNLEPELALKKES